jgi:hypothetical protein
MQFLVVTIVCNRQLEQRTSDIVEVAVCAFAEPSDIRDDVIDRVDAELAREEAVIVSIVDDIVVCFIFVLVLCQVYFWAEAVELECARRDDIFDSSVVCSDETAYDYI